MTALLALLAAGCSGSSSPATGLGGNTPSPTAGSDRIVGSLDVSAKFTAALACDGMKIARAALRDADPKTAHYMTAAAEDFHKVPNPVAQGYADQIREASAADPSAQATAIDDAIAFCRVNGGF